MNPTLYSQLLRLAMPETIVVVTALLVLTIDLAFLRSRLVRTRFFVASLLASTGCMIAIARLVHVPQSAGLLDGMFISNQLTSLVQIALLLLTIVTLLLSAESTFTEHVGEFVLLVLLATAGMLFLVAARNTLVIFVSLELLSLSLYALSAFDKRSAKGAEAALKYFLFGGMSAAFLLFGFSLLYGYSNSTDLVQIGYAVGSHGLTPVLVIAIVTAVIGLGFKVAAAPFHFWAPDVYECAPSPAVGFIASASKVASFYIFFVLLTIGFPSAAGSAAWSHFTPGWSPVIAGVAVLSMVLGNLAAIVQSSVRRLLAYSAIAHAGYMLIAIASHTQQSLSALIYYVVTYSLATLGMFAIVGVVEAETGGDKLSNFDGLSRRAPVLSACMFVFLLSQVGIPPLAGFFAKFYLFVAALGATTPSNGLLWLVVIALAMSAVSLYYYLRVLKRVYISSPAEGAGELKAPFLTQVVVVVLAAGVMLLGCAPHLLLRWIDAAMQASGS
jgi:NADH-quinone oxidoreductase subunit N